tara:strand:+ start:108 stop:821 length:714 start_codon:yes stop_codon:yes gene_type:complete
MPRKTQRKQKRRKTQNQRRKQRRTNRSRKTRRGGTRTIRRGLGRGLHGISKFFSLTPQYFARTEEEQEAYEVGLINKKTNELKALLKNETLDINTSNSTWAAIRGLINENIEDIGGIEVKDNQTVWYRVCWLGCIKAVRELIHHNKNSINKEVEKDGNKYTPLFAAVWNGHTEVVKTLLEQDEVVEFLLEHKTDSDFANPIDGAIYQMTNKTSQEQVYTDIKGMIDKKLSELTGHEN